MESETKTTPATNGNGSWAKTLVIPDGVGVPLVGKTLGVALNDPKFGVAIVKFLSGKYPNASGELFVPKNQAHEIIQKGALTILPEILQAEEAKKKAKAKKPQESAPE